MYYKGYAARVEFDAEDEIFTGRIAGIRDMVGFHADNVADLKEAFHEAVDDYLETLHQGRQRPSEALFRQPDAAIRFRGPLQGGLGGGIVWQKPQPVGRGSSVPSGAEGCFTMSHIKSGHLTASGEWRKHLRPWYKRAFWKRHRAVEDIDAKRNAGQRIEGPANRTRLGRED